MRKNICVALVALAFLCVSIPAMAQYKPTAEETNILKRAHELERDGRHEDAKDLYEKLYANVKNDNIFWKLLLVCEHLADYDRMEEIIRERLALNPDDPSMRRYLARVYYGRGDADGGRKILMDIMDGHWSDVGRTYLVANELTQQNELDEVVRIYLKVRENTGNKALFAPSLASIYAARTEYPAAIGEMLKQIEAVQHVEKSIRDLIKRARDGGTDILALERPVVAYLDTYPGSIRAARIVADLRFERGDFTGARMVLFPAAKASGSPQDVVDLAEKLRRGGYIAESLEVYRDYYRIFSDDPLRISAMLDAAGMLAESGDVTGALDIYNELARDYGGTREGAIAHLRWLALSEAVTEYDAFVNALTVFADSVSWSDVSREASMVLGKAMLANNSPEDARGMFEKARLASRSKRERYDCAVYSALLNFFTGEYESMKNDIAVVVANDPGGSTVNELLTFLALTMKGASDGGESLSAYAAGTYALYRNDVDGAVEHFARAAQDTASAVSAFAAMELAEAHAGDDDYGEAESFYRKAAAISDEQALAAKSLALAGDMYVRTVGNYDRAAEFYLEVLTDIPGTVRESEIRRKLRAIMERR